MRKLIALLALGLVVISILILGACASVDGTPSKTVVEAPATLIGQWQETNPENPSLVMSAEVSAGSIQIEMKTRDSSSIYWLGTFDTDQNPAGSFQTISKGDQDAMNLSLLGSRDATKTFNYENGVLSYKFTMMGTTTTVKLTK